jgi:hypothetical protein
VKKMWVGSWFAGLAFGIASVGSTEADINAKLYVYPSKGQSEAQQNEDKSECHQWATNQTGVDPEQLAQQSYADQAAESAPSETGAAAIGGGASGAALGAVGGAIGGSAGKGAAIGAAVGGLASAFGARRRMRERQQHYQQSMANEEAQMQQYDQAYATCLRGRGYTVSGGGN